MRTQLVADVVDFGQLTAGWEVMDILTYIISVYLDLWRWKNSLTVFTILIARELHILVRLRNR